MRKRTRWAAACAVLLVALLAVAYVAVSRLTERPASGPAVRVDAGNVLATIHGAAYGVNSGVWDAHLLDGAVPGLLSQAGVTALRFPGGSTADQYHWQTNSTTPGHSSYTNPDNTFDAFMGVARKVGAQPIITVNYGSNAAGNGGGDPAEAAAWVRYANVTKHYGIKYWEIGNEVYGNGTYPGANWETDLHSAKGPAAYATNLVAYAQAMKAVDPSIAIGAVLTAPGAKPDGESPDWNNTVLSIAGSKIDFVIVHWYAQAPGSETDAGLLSSTDRIAGMVSGLRAKIEKYLGDRARQIEILATETNSVYANPGKQTVSLVNALFLADNFAGWLERGVASVVWWDLHNSADTTNNNSSALYGTAGYGDYGILSSGASAGAASDPPANTPYPPYYGLQMLSYLGKAGDQFVAAQSNRSMIAAHAVKQADGNVALLLINKDPAKTFKVRVSVAGHDVNGTATIYRYGKGSAAIKSRDTKGYSGNFTLSIAPYSLTTIVLYAGASSPPRPAATTTSVAPTPTSLTGTATAAPSATPSAPATSTETPSATNTATATSTPTASATSTDTASATPTPRPSSTATATDTQTASATPTQTPTATPGPSPAFTQASAVSPPTVPAGSSATIHTTLTNTGGSLNDGIVDVEIFDAQGTRVNQQYFRGKSIAAGRSADYSVSWNPRTSGTYTVKVGVFGSNWAPNLFWSANAATIDVK